MPNEDLGHKLTDAKLEKLERRIAKLYREVWKELQETIDAYFEQFKKRDEEMKQVKPRMAYYTEVEMSLSEALGTKVRICEGKKTNTLQISFEDKDQLEGILRLMDVK